MQLADSLPPGTRFLTARGEITAASLRGSKLVVYFYPKDDTPGCTTEGKDFTAHQQQFDQADCRIIGVSKDSLDKHCKFADKYGFGFDLASDAEGALCELFQVWKENSMYGKKYMGIERSTFLFDRKGTLAKVWRKVKVSGHVADVLAAAQSI